MIASVINHVAALWGVIGLIFASWFVAFGLYRVDANTSRAGLGFRLMILPGAAALWPLLLWRCLRGPRDGAPERNAHRRATEAR